MTTIRVTDETTPEELREAITNLARTASRTPAHYVETKAKYHARIDALLDELDGRAATPHA